MVIDWDATGSMVSGLGTWVGAAVVAGAALLGRNTFDAWKRQKAEENRMQAAERIMMLAYKLKDNFEGIRGPFTPQHELQVAEDALRKDEAWWKGLGEEAQKRYRSAQAYLNRINHYQDDWGQVWSLKPVALAYFGDEVARNLEALWREKAKLAVSADAYAQDDGSDPKFSAKVRCELWGQPGSDDPVGAAIGAAVASLEQVLLPVIRAAGAT